MIQAPDQISLADLAGKASKTGRVDTLAPAPGPGPTPPPSRINFSIMTLSIMTLSVITLSIMALRITAFSISIN